MNKLNKKQKIILTIFVSVILAGWYYYTYTKDNDFSVEQGIEIEEQASSNADISEEERTNEKIKVHIVGAVVQEGLVELEQGSRIADAIELAGGLKVEACAQAVNLAYVLEDGMQIKIPTNEEVEKGLITSDESNNTSNYISEIKETSNNINTKININIAKQSELEMLPGIGEATANKIINYRNEHGKFKTIEEIKNVKGIGESKFNSIKELIGV